MGRLSYPEQRRLKASIWPSAISAFDKPLIEHPSRDAKVWCYLTNGKLAQTSHSYDVISKLLRVVLCHKLILAWKLCPDYKSQLNRQQRPPPVLNLPVRIASESVGVRDFFVESVKLRTPMSPGFVGLGGTMNAARCAATRLLGFADFK